MDEALRDVLLGLSEDREDLALLDDAAVFHDGDAVTDLLDDGHLVRDEHDRDAERFIEVLEKVQDRLRCLRVERGGRLVAQKHLWVVGKGAGDGDALLLSAGELAGVGVRLVADADEFQERCDLLLDILLAQAAALERVGDVSGHRARRHQVEVLEDHADLLARRAQVLGRERRQVLSRDEDAAGAWPLQKVDASHERGLARAREADDPEDLARADGERHVAHGVHGLFARAEVLGNVLEFDQVNSSFIPKANKKSGELMSSPLQVKRCSGGKTLLRAFNQRRQFRSCAYRAGK